MAITRAGHRTRPLYQDYGERRLVGSKFCDRGCGRLWCWVRITRNERLCMAHGLEAYLADRCGVIREPSRVVHQPVAPNQIVADWGR